jgi:hypothetical protein
MLLTKSSWIKLLLANELITFLHIYKLFARRDAIGHLNKCFVNQSLSKRGTLSEMCEVSQESPKVRSDAIKMVTIQ